MSFASEKILKKQIIALNAIERQIYLIEDVNFPK